MLKSIIVVNMKSRLPKFRITEQDLLLANRRSAREEDVCEHGKPTVFRTHLSSSKKAYKRERFRLDIAFTSE